MTIDELKQLIPMYVANTLSQEEREVLEREVKSSEELRREVSFWRHARAATESHFDYLQEGHLTSEIITAYVEETLQSENERQTIEQHLQQCVSCNDEVDVLKKTIIPTEPSRMRPTRKDPSTFFERLIGQLFKPIVAVPVGVTVVILVLLLINKQPELTERSVPLTLEYQSLPRGNNGDRLTEVLLESDITMIQTTLIVPEPAQTSWYSVHLIPPDRIPIRIVDTLRNYSTEGRSVRLNVEIPAQHLSKTDGTYTITVQELSSELEQQFSGEMYEIQFTVVRKWNRLLFQLVTTCQFL